MPASTVQASSASRVNLHKPDKASSVISFSGGENWVCKMTKDFKAVTARVGKDGRMKTWSSMTPRAVSIQP